MTRQKSTSFSCRNGMPTDRQSGNCITGTGNSQRKTWNGRYVGNAGLAVKLRLHGRSNAGQIAKLRGSYGRHRNFLVSIRNHGAGRRAKLAAVRDVAVGMAGRRKGIRLSGNGRPRMAMDQRGECRRTPRLYLGPEIGEAGIIQILRRHVRSFKRKGLPLRGSRRPESWLRQKASCRKSGTSSRCRYPDHCRGSFQTKTRGTRRWAPKRRNRLRCDTGNRSRCR